MKTATLLFLAAVVAAVSVAPLAAGTSSSAPLPGRLADVTIEQKLNSQAPLDVMLRDEAGKPVEFGSYFGHRPVILAFVYFKCPMLCTYVVNGVLRSMRAMSFSAGEQFDFLAVSIDPHDQPAVAAVQKEQFLKEYRRAGSAGGIHFLTGDSAAIARLTAAVGFKYNKDPETGEYNHAAGIMILTPEGKVSHYFYGVEYPTQDLRLSLVAASHNKIGNPVDAFLLYCCRYDPTTGRYTLAINRVMQVAGAATVLVLGGFMIVMFRRDHDGEQTGQE